MKTQDYNMLEIPAATIADCERQNAKFFNIVALAIGINIAVFYAVLTLCPLEFEVNDDVTMMTIVSGIFTGEPDAHIWFQNLIVGKLLSSLYTINDAVPWYGLWMYGTHFLAMIALSVALMLRFRPLLGSLLYGSIFFFFELPFLLRLQFTTTAAMASVCGLAVWISYRFVDSGQLGKVLTSTMGFILIVVGAMIRIDAFLLVCLVFLPVMLFDLTKSWSKGTLAGLFFSGVVCVGALLYSNSYYSNHSHWRTYSEQRRLEVKIENSFRAMERYNKDSDARPSSLDAINLGGFAEEKQQRLYIDSLRTIIEEVSRAKCNIVETLKHRFGRNSLGWVAICTEKRILALTLVHLAFIPVLFGFRRTRHFLPIGLASVLIAAAVCVYFIWQGNRLPGRVLWSAVCATNIAILFSWPRNLGEPDGFLGQLTSRRGKGLACVLLLAYSLLVIKNMNLVADVFQENRQHHIKLDQKLNQLTKLSEESRSPRPIFVFAAPAFPLEWIDPLDSCNELRTLRQIHLTWTVGSPLHYKVLSKYSINNLLRALYQRSDIYLVGSIARVNMLKAVIYAHHKVRVCDELILKQSEPGYVVVRLSQRGPMCL